MAHSKNKKIDLNNRRSAAEKLLKGEASPHRAVGERSWCGKEAIA
jgi:hypothetical protein